MKKKLFVLLMMGIAATPCFARSSSDDGIGTFITVVLAVFGILNIILFFKIWGMTNNVALLKKKIVDHSHGDDLMKQCRKLMLLGRKDEVREIIIDVFFNEVEHAFEELKYDAPAKENLKKQSITNKVDQLRRNLSNIGETVPENIAKLATYGDYLDMIKIEK